MNEQAWTLIGVAAVALIVIGGLAFLSQRYSLDNIKSKTVGDGQFGTARWATKKEIHETYTFVPFQPELWRAGQDLPTEQGLVIGCVGGSPPKRKKRKKPAKPNKLTVMLDKVLPKKKTKDKSAKQKKVAPKQGKKKKSILPKKIKYKEQGPKKQHNPIRAIVDTDDIHALVTAASGAGKTAYFLYPNIEYALASGMSFLCTDTKGDLFRNYAGIARDRYGFNIAILDLRNPTKSDGDNLLHLINKYMDIYKSDPTNLAAKAKSEKYAKILAKTLINTGESDASYGQNQFFYDAAEGLLTAMFLVVAEYLPTKDEQGNPIEQRHIVSVFKLVQELLAPTQGKGHNKNKNSFQLLLDHLPENHKAKWFAGAALNSADQALASILSTVLSRLNAFLDSEMEQILCFDTAIDAEKFCNEKSAIFVVLPEEDNTKYFMVSLIIQNLYREILTVADENGGRLKNRVVFFADELGSCPPIQSLELMFSASRSRGLMLVPIVQSITGQLQKNYGKEGSEIIVDNCQVNIFGGFAPGSQTAETLSEALGKRTVLSGTVTQSKDKPSQTMQMISRPLITPDELKVMPKGSFIVAKTGVHPMQVQLRLFLDWGIRFEKPYEVPEKVQRPVAYATKDALELAIQSRQSQSKKQVEPDVQAEEGVDAEVAVEVGGDQESPEPGEVRP